MIRLLALVMILATGPAWAAQTRYALDPQGSTVGFAWDFGADEIKGNMPVAQADLALDFANLPNSTVTVAVDVTGAEAGFPFASQAMKGPRVLDAGQYPHITFVSSAIRRDGDGARIDGSITVRGVTRPMVLAAHLYRAEGSATADLSRLTVILTGALSRAAFGADGWSDLAGDEVRLNIRAVLRQVN